VDAPLLARLLHRLRPSRRRRIAEGRRAARVLALAAALALAGAAAAEPLTLRLAELPARGADGRWSVAGAAGGRLHATPGEALDLFLHLPEQAQLFVALLPNVPAGRFHVLVATDEDGEHELALERSGTGWRGDLSGLAGRIVRLRLANASGAPLDWLGPRIAGTREQDPPLLTAAPPGTERPSILLYVVDALRADHLSLYGYGRPTSPRLEALARRAVVFDHAYSAAADTMGSLPALLLSTPASVAIDRLRRRLPTDPTLPERLRAAGYATAAFQTNFTLRPALGFARGFARYELMRPKPERPVPKIGADELHAAALPWLVAERDKPAFTWIQSLDTHNPYDPPAPFLGRFGGKPGLAHELDPDRYDEAIAYADHALGELLDALERSGRLAHTAVVVTADHGESLGEGGRRLHGSSFHQELVHVPLLVALPWQRGPVRVGETVSLMDLAPTLLELAGVAVPEPWQGHSLLAATPRDVPRSALGERSRQEAWFLVEGRWKLVDRDGRPRLFDVDADPAEQRDLADQRPITLGYLERRLWERSPAVRSGAAPRPLREGLDAKERKELDDALRALGYAQ
jgi:arylsulfatase A-like enzyme